MLLAGYIIKNEYKIIKVIGNGGMGSIYLCSEVKDSDKKWALKEMRLSQINVDLQEKAIKHFEMEAEILSRLNHLNLPGVKEYFKEQGNYYLVMEFIEGEDLGKLLDRNSGPFSEELVLKWGTQMATALYFLHIQKPHPIIYRDLKPSNIIVTPDGNIKLVDFGIARFFQPGKKKDTVQMGSLGYAPPEQFGEGQTDERSDIYSLGITLHQLLTKRDPAEADNPFKIPLVRTINKDISIELERIIQRTTQFEAIRRYQKVSDLKRDLKSLYDEKLRKSSMTPISTQLRSSIQPVAISTVETERLPVQERDLPCQPKPSVETGPEEIKQKEIPVNQPKPSVETGPEELKQKEIPVNQPKPSVETGPEEIKQKEDTMDKKEKIQDKTPIQSKKKKSLVSTVIIFILFTFLAVTIYYLKPPWLVRYLSFIPGITSVPVEQTPSPVPGKEVLNLKEQALIKYHDGKFSEAALLIEEALKNSPSDSESMIIKSNIGLGLHNNDSFSSCLIVSRKGKNNPDGEDIMKGAFLALKEINSNFGVRGKMLKLDIIDDYSDFNLLFNNINQADFKNFISLIGPDDYTLDLAIAPLVKTSSLLQFSPCLSMNVQYDRPFTFGLSPDRKSELEAIHNLIYKKLSKKKIATVYDIQNPYFFELNYIFKEEILAKERNIVNDIPVRGDIFPQEEEINRILNSLNVNKPDVILFFSSPYLVKQLALEIRKKDRDVIFITGHWAMSGQLITDKYDATEGLLCLCPVLNNEEGFIKKYREVFSDNSLVLRSAQVYDAFILLKEAINASGFRKEDIRSYLMKFNETNPYSGKSGKIYFSVKEGHRETGWRVLQIINHNFTVHISEI